MNAPIKLEWHKHSWGYDVTVPAKDICGAGKLVISAIRRPHYCDRGKWHVLVQTEGVFPLDDQEGFPRYFFKLENLMDEMECWVNERDIVQAAVK